RNGIERMTGRARPAQEQAQPETRQRVRRAMAKGVGYLMQKTSLGREIQEETSTAVAVKGHTGVQYSYAPYYVMLYTRARWHTRVSNNAGEVWRPRCMDQAQSFQPQNPLIVQSDHTLLLEVHNPLYEAARTAIGAFAELEKSPEHIHTYRITP